MFPKYQENKRLNKKNNPQCLSIQGKSPDLNLLHMKCYLFCSSGSSSSSSALQCKVPATDLELLQVGPLHVDHCCEQLVLQAVSRDSEVDEGALCLQLGLEMGVCQLRVEDETEGRVEVTFLVPDLNVPEIRAKETRAYVFQDISPKDKWWYQSMASTSMGLGILHAENIVKAEKHSKLDTLQPLLI